MSASSELLVEVLASARASGFLGPGAVQEHVRHARGFAAAADLTPGRVVDLGSGGGVPGLVLALEWPTATVVLLDASARRTAFLEVAVRRLGVQGRVSVVRAAAEDAGRDPALRATADLVVARSFAIPAVTAECAAPLLRHDGLLVVSEPPEPGERWPASGLEALGLGPAELVEIPQGNFARMRQRSLCPPEFPRRAGVPSKRPLF